MLKDTEILDLIDLQDSPPIPFEIGDYPWIRIQNFGGPPDTAFCTCSAHLERGFRLIPMTEFLLTDPDGLVDANQHWVKMGQCERCCRVFYEEGQVTP